MSNNMFILVIFEFCPKTLRALKLNGFKALSAGRARRTRTLNKGFGDPRVTITPLPYGR